MASNNKGKVIIVAEVKQGNIWSLVTGRVTRFFISINKTLGTQREWKLAKEENVPRANQEIFSWTS